MDAVGVEKESIMNEQQLTGPIAPRFCIVDRSEQCFTDDVLIPFAIEELWCRAVTVPLVHIWRHRQAFVLGLRDRRLPHAPKAIRRLVEEGYSAAVRHSGGAAVPLDSGVVNLSLIAPKAIGDMRLKPYFQWMSHLICSVAADFGVFATQGEVAGSFCPGEYDISVDGRKFCGIAQRRQVSGVNVQAFVLVEGSGERRAEQVRRFYEESGSGAPDEDHPVVLPSVTTSLQEVCGAYVTGFIDALLARLAQVGGTLTDWALVKPREELVLRTANELARAYGTTDILYKE
jgi:octanoyl-[GcvH]:protein N-octanoyltransferase